VRKAPFLALLALASACLWRSEAPDWASIRADLEQRVAIDQELRSELIEQRESPAPETFQRLAAVDQDNTGWMKALVERFGWPTRTLVGAEGAHHAWLLVQHADQDPDFQEHCLGLMGQAVALGEADPKDLAYLEDRVALSRGRPQRYGTQFVADSGGQGLVPHTLADPDHVDELRASVGLGTLEEYAAMVNATH